MTTPHFTLPPLGTPEFHVLFDALAAYVSDLQETVPLVQDPEMEAKLALATKMEGMMSAALADLSQ